MEWKNGMVGLKLIFRRFFSEYSYSIYRPTNDKDIPEEEIAYLNCRENRNGDGIFLLDFFVAKHSPAYRGYEECHLGTNLLSDALTDLYFRLGIRYKTISGELAAMDSNRNWRSSIPFYRDFPKYLNSSLPFSLELEISPEKDFSVVFPKNLPVGKIIEKYRGKDLFFHYICAPK